MCQLLCLVSLYFSFPSSFIDTYIYTCNMADKTRCRFTAVLRGGGGVQPKFLGKAISEIRVIQNPPPIGRYTCTKFRILKNRSKVKTKVVDLTSQCPEHFLFEIGPKMTKLCGDAHIYGMGARANFGYFCAREWPNSNIFQWDLFI